MQNVWASRLINSEIVMFVSEIVVNLIIGCNYMTASSSTKSNNDYKV